MTVTWSAWSASVTSSRAGSPSWSSSATSSTPTCTRPESAARGRVVAGLVNPQAERVPRRVETDAHVLLGLVVSQPGTARQRMLQGTRQVDHLHLEVHLRRRLAGLTRPHG